MNLSFFQILSRLFQFAENVKCRRISLELISWGPHSRFKRKRNFFCRLFTSSIKRENRDFQAVVVQWRLLFWRSRCRRHRRCYSFLLGNLSTRRSWYRGRQPQVFLLHDSHCACQEVLELRSRTSKREFSGWNQRFKFWVLREYSSHKSRTSLPEIMFSS